MPRNSTKYFFKNSNIGYELIDAGCDGMRVIDAIDNDANLAARVSTLRKRQSFSLAERAR